MHGWGEGLMGARCVLLAGRRWAFVVGRKGLMLMLDGVVVVGVDRTFLEVVWSFWLWRKHSSRSNSTTVVKWLEFYQVCHTRMK